MVDSSVKRGSYGVGRERRERILAAATERFSNAGYSQTSLAEIARQVGITTPGLTHHFPTKQHLLLAIVERRFGVAQQIADAVEGELDGTRTVKLLQSIADTFASDPGLLRLFVLVAAETADASSPAHALFTARYEGVVADIARLFEEEAAAGALRPDIDYRDLARECIAVSDGLQLQWVVTGGQIDLAALIRNHLERIVSSIAMPSLKRPESGAAAV